MEQHYKLYFIEQNITWLLPFNYNLGYSFTSVATTIKFHVIKNNVEVEDVKASMVS